MKPRNAHATKEKHLFWLKEPVLLLLPYAGMAIFVILYVIAALEYPGGSYAEPNVEGFSFWHNYLCDLLDKRAINGSINTARYHARWSLGILCTSLLFLWANLPKLFRIKSYNLYLMWLAGLFALITVAFLGSGTHDITVRIAGVFGIIAMLGCSFELYKVGYHNLVILGISCLLVFLLNYYIYETGMFRGILPVIQKLTFVLFLVWFVLLNWVLYRKCKMLALK